MLFVLFNLTAYEVLSQQQRYNFPYFDVLQEQTQCVVKEWTPTGLTRTTSPTRFAHSFNSKLRISFDPPHVWENVGGIFISSNTQPEIDQSRFYIQDYTTRMGARTRFHDIAYVPKSALEDLYDRIYDPNNPNMLNGLTQTQIDSINNFMFLPNSKNTFREGLLIVVGDYTSYPYTQGTPPQPPQTCPEQTNAGIYVIDATTFQPLRFFKFFTPCGKKPTNISGSSFTAVRYLNEVDRFVAVGSVDYQNNTDILAFTGNLLYLAWSTLPGFICNTNRYDITRPVGGTRESLQDIATGVDFRYFRKPAPPYYQVGNGAIVISGYTKNNQNEEKSFILRVAHNGAFVRGNIKNNTSNNRAHAVTFKTNSAIIDEDAAEELALTGFIGADDAQQIYISQFDQDLNFILDARYPRTGINATEQPGFSIVSTGNGYAVTGNYSLSPTNINRQHLSYLRVDNTLTNIEHTIFPFNSDYESYGQRMRFNTASNSCIMLGGTKTTSNLGVGGCTCLPKCPECTTPLCPLEYQAFTISPLTLTLSSNNCNPDISTQSIFCANDCWFKLSQCGLSSMGYDVCVSGLEEGKRAKLYELKGDNCHDTYCGRE